ncbi:MAG: DUF1295 domain-containing protein [Alphaproteobacteria bacterium]|nr:DUF1295 domain-containing protein [Alphaproteobacteria bacterium]
MQDDAAYWRGTTWVSVTYFAAFSAGMLAVALAPELDPYWRAGLADLVATLVVFAFSLAFRNASLYDPYWSVAPIALVAYWTVAASGEGVLLRQAMVMGVVAFWGTRLTTNWAIGWGGLDHEDWRYLQLRQRTGFAYPLVNLLGIHLMPTVLVFAALWPAYEAVTAPTPIGLLDGVAFAVTAGATVLEGMADKQLHAFQARHPPAHAYIDEGLWRWSRHPNYLGEILFWWGLWLFAVAVGDEHAVTCVGALGIALLFRFASIPMMERRLLERRPSYAEQIARVPMLFPRPPRHAAARGSAPVPEVDLTPDRILDERARLSIDTMPFVPPPDAED